MSEWKEVRLGDVCDFQNGYAHKSEDFVKNGSHKVIKIRELKDGEIKFYDDSASVRIIDDTLKKYVVKKNDILFALTGDPVNKSNPLSWVGRVSRYNHNKDAVLNQRVCKVINQTDIDLKYLYYYFRQFNVFYELASKATGSASQANISTKTIAETLLYLPPLETQKKIASVLSVLDEKIELNNKINKDLEDMAQAIFKSWFVDFEPFGGVMPDGWMVKNLSEIANIDSGYSYKGAELQPSSTAMATIKNFERLGGFKLTGFKEIIPSNKIKNSHYVNKFDILVAHTDLTQNADIIGNAEILLSLDQYDKIIASMDLVKVTAKENYNNFFIATMLKSKNFKDHALSYVNGTTVLHLSKKALHEYSIFLPNDISIIDKTSQSFKWIYTQISSNLEESSILSQFRDTLLPRLMSGEIDVGNVEI